MEAITSDPAISALATFLRTLDAGATWFTPLDQKIVQSTGARIDGLLLTVKTVFAVIPNHGDGDTLTRLTLVTIQTPAERRASYALDPVT